LELQRYVRTNGRTDKHMEGQDEAIRCFSRLCERALIRCLILCWRY